MTKHKGGRPLKFQSVEELQKRIDAYFNECDPHVKEVTEWVMARDGNGKLLKDNNGLNYLRKVTHFVKTEQVPYTITGLALYLDTSRQTLLTYEGEVPGSNKIDSKFFDTIKRAKERVQNYLELNLNSPSPTGTIFNLKNNFDWKDKQEQEISNPDGSLNPYSKLTAEQLRKLAD